MKTPSRLAFARGAAMLAPLLLLGACADAYGPGPYPGPFPDRAPVGARPGEVVNVLGCARAGVPAGCLAVVDANGMAWDISAARPQPDPYGQFMVEVTGRVSDQPSPCQQGPALSEVQWRYTAIRCPR